MDKGTVGEQRQGSGTGGGTPAAHSVSESFSKSPDDSFRDWEATVFGFGYGTGEEHVLGALKAFLGATRGDNGSYDYRELEALLTPPVAWLLINALGHADIIEYGTSPRYGWLTMKGRRLRQFVTERGLEDLMALMNYDQEHTICHPDACNCGPHGYEAGRKCVNPFW